MWQRIISYGLAALCLAGFLPAKGAHVVDPLEPSDSLNSPLYLYTEGIKQQLIYGDTAQARQTWLQVLDIDSTYAPAHYKLGEILLRQPATERQGIDHARKAYEADTSNKFYLLYYAHSLLYGGDFDEARTHFHRLLRIEKHNTELYRLTALLEEQMGNRPAAIALLDSAEVLFGHESRLGGIKRRMLIAEGRTEEALREAQAHIEAIPYEIDGYLVLGEIYARTGQDSLASHHFKRAFELDSTSLETLLTLADFQLARQQYAEYLDLSRRIFELDEVNLSDKIAVFNRFTADQRFYRAYWPQISTLARTLAMRYPNEPEVVHLYGHHLIASGSIEQALIHYKHHLDDTPPQVEYYAAVVDMEGYLGRVDSAEAYLQRAVEHFPKRAELRLQQGNFAAIYHQNEQSAIARYNEALEIAESDSLRSIAWGFIGDSYQRLAQGEYPSIELAFEAASSDKRENRRLTREMKRCFAAYEKALTYDPENVGVLNNYAYFLALGGDSLEQALTLSSLAIALQSSNPTYLDTHAWVLYKLGRYDEAKRYLQHALSLDGQRSPELQMHYGDLLAAMGEKYLAQVYWKRAEENGYDPGIVKRRIEALEQQP